MSKTFIAPSSEIVTLTTITGFSSGRVMPVS